MSLLGLADFPAVRAVLDVSLDSTALPDAVIALPVYQGAGEADVLRIDPLAATREGAEARHVRNAACYFTAARIAPALPSIQSESLGDVRYQRQAVDWGKRAMELAQRGRAEMDALLQPGAATPERPRMFALACGGRGR